MIASLPERGGYLRRLLPFQEFFQLFETNWILKDLLSLLDFLLLDQVQRIFANLVGNIDRRIFVVFVGDYGRLGIATDFLSEEEVFGLRPIAGVDPFETRLLRFTLLAVLTEHLLTFLFVVHRSRRLLIESLAHRHAEVKSLSSVYSSKMQYEERLAVLSVRTLASRAEANCSIERRWRHRPLTN